MRVVAALLSICVLGADLARAGDQEEQTKEIEPPSYYVSPPATRDAKWSSHEWALGNLLRAGVRWCELEPSGHSVRDQLYKRQEFPLHFVRIAVHGVIEGHCTVALGRLRRDGTEHLELVGGAYTWNKASGALASLGPELNATCQFEYLSRDGPKKQRLKCASTETLSSYRDGLEIRFGRVSAELGAQFQAKASLTMTVVLSGHLYDALKVKLLGVLPQAPHILKETNYKPGDYSRLWLPLADALQVLPNANLGTRLFQSELEEIPVLTIGRWTLGMGWDEFTKERVPSHEWHSLWPDSELLLRATDLVRKRPGPTPQAPACLVEFAPARTLACADGRKLLVSHYIGALREGRPHGAGAIYFVPKQQKTTRPPADALVYKGLFTDGRITGAGSFFSSGQVESSGSFLAGMKHGLVFEYFHDGALDRVGVHRFGKPTSGPVYRREYRSRPVLEAVRCFVGRREGGKETGSYSDIERVYRRKDGEVLWRRGDLAVYSWPKTKESLTGKYGIPPERRTNVGERESFYGTCQFLTPRGRLVGTFDRRVSFISGPATWHTPDGKSYSVDVQDGKWTWTTITWVRVRKAHWTRRVWKEVKRVTKRLYKEVLRWPDDGGKAFEKFLCELVGKEPGKDCHVNGGVQVGADGGPTLLNTDEGYKDWHSQAIDRSTAFEASFREYLAQSRAEEIEAAAATEAGRITAILLLGQATSCHGLLGGQKAGTPEAQLDAVLAAYAADNADALLALIRDGGSLPYDLAAPVGDPEFALQYSAFMSGNVGRGPAGFWSSLQALFGFAGKLEAPDAIWRLNQVVESKKAKSFEEQLRLWRASEKIRTLGQLSVAPALPAGAAILGELAKARFGVKGARARSGQPDISPARQYEFARKWGVRKEAYRRAVAEIGEPRTESEVYLRTAQAIALQAGIPLGEVNAVK